MFTAALFTTAKTFPLLKNNRLWIPCNNRSESFLFKDFLKFIFRQRGREEEREVEKHQCVVASRTPPAEDLAHNPSMCLTGN